MSDVASVVGRPMCLCSREHAAKSARQFGVDVDLFEHEAEWELLLFFLCVRASLRRLLYGYEEEWEGCNHEVVFAQLDELR